MKLIPEFAHKSPLNTHYEFESFKSNVVSIWICYDRHFVYNSGKSTKCIWGFYNTKTSKFFSPVNPKTIGKEVDFKQTTPYSAMIPKTNPLTAAFA